MMHLVDFRRLCVRYGEARRKAQDTNMPEEYVYEWKKECNRLWNKIQDEERLLFDALSISPLYIKEQEKDLWRRF